MKLIDKDALVAEIDKQKIGYNTDGKHSIEYNTVKKILDILNTLEVKEVDLKKEIQDKIYNHFYDLEGIAIAGTSIYATVDDMEHIAKYFFELGLKAQKGE